MTYTPLPIGVDDFEEIIQKEYYYVDKTLLIKELLDKKGKVNLFTRPRRFGKTLNLSMLKCFFEYPTHGNSRSALFDGLKIKNAGEQYMQEQGLYPVIMLSLKSAKQPDYDMAYASLVDDISREYNRHGYVLQSDRILKADREKFVKIRDRKADKIDYAKSLLFLSQCLSQYHGVNTIILIDEYDVPLENAYFSGFYDRMIAFIRSLFESALKTNPYLEFSVITGCLRISKESIFTGLNNLKILTILDTNYDEYFGFTEEEVHAMLSFYHRESNMEVARHWYDGYRFGSTEVYNPWSIINYVEALASNEHTLPTASWSNSSSNSIIRELVEQADIATRREIESLIEGHSIEKPIHEEITYEDIHSTRDNLWNFLFFTGYLRCIEQRLEQEMIYLKLQIPNAEVRSIYRNTILNWFDEKLKSTNRSPLYAAMEQGDCKTMTDIISQQLLETISFYDYAESYYHGFLAGLFSGSQKYLVISNRESGTGRPDLLLEAYTRRGMAIIIEVKVSKSFQDLETDCQKALRQIEEKSYEAGVRAEGYQNIRKYGISFYQKDCLVLEG